MSITARKKDTKINAVGLMEHVFLTFNVLRIATGKNVISALISVW